MNFKPLLQCFLQLRLLVVFFPNGFPVTLLFPIPIWPCGTSLPKWSNQQPYEFWFFFFSLGCFPNWCPLSKTHLVLYFWSSLFLVLVIPSYWFPLFPLAQPPLLSLFSHLHLSRTLEPKQNLFGLREEELRRMTDQSLFWKPLFPPSGEPLDSFLQNSSYSPPPK